MAAADQAGIMSSPARASSPCGTSASAGIVSSPVPTKPGRGFSRTSSPCSTSADSTSALWQSPASTSKMGSEDGSLAAPAYITSSLAEQRGPHSKSPQDSAPPVGIAPPPGLEGLEDGDVAVVPTTWASPETGAAPPGRPPLKMRDLVGAAVFRPAELDPETCGAAVEAGEGYWPHSSSMQMQAGLEGFDGFGHAGLVDCGMDPSMFWPDLASPSSTAYYDGTSLVSPLAESWISGFDLTPTVPPSPADVAQPTTPSGPVMKLDLAEALPEPDLGTPELPTVGSSSHRFGTCKPCAFLHTKGCVNGVQCQFCHLCDSGEKKRRQQEKKEQKRSLLRWKNEQQATAMAVGMYDAVTNTVGPR